MYRAALPFVLEGHLWRSANWADFMTWLKSDDRSAEDLRGIIADYGLRDMAREWVSKRRALYENDDDHFEKDKAVRLVTKQQP